MWTTSSGIHEQFSAQPSTRSTVAYHDSPPAPQPRSAFQGLEDIFRELKDGSGAVLLRFPPSWVAEQGEDACERAFLGLCALLMAANGPHGSVDWATFLPRCHFRGFKTSSIQRPLQRSSLWLPARVPGDRLIIQWNLFQRTSRRMANPTMGVAMVVAPTTKGHDATTAVDLRW